MVCYACNTLKYPTSYYMNKFHFSRKGQVVVAKRVVIGMLAFALSFGVVPGIGLTTATPIVKAAAAPADFPPQIDGTIKSIQAGNPSYVILENVSEVGDNRKWIHKSEEKIKLPSGRFISKNHWQSNGDTLDLFIGEDFSKNPNTGQMTGIGPDQGFAGIVKSINRKEMVVQKILYDTASGDSRAMKYTNLNVKIHLAPYTSVSINGDGSKKPTSVVHVGDPILFVLIGPPTEYIVTQITDFKSISSAGWIMK